MRRLTPLAAFLVVSIAPTVLAGDVGDAPAGYGVASHAVVPGAPRLGENAPDDDVVPLGDAAAEGDDVTGLDDEDGVFAFPELVQNGKAYTTNVFASNPGTAAATLVGWVDFDGDGRFDSDEAATDTVPAGADDEKFKLLWPDLRGVSSDYSGTTYARFRISTDALDAGDATGEASDGEVEDYTFEILLDVDGDEIPDARDTDNDNDGIPDEVEVVGTDTDGDGTPDYLDDDSDGDGLPDFVEAGPEPATPIDSDGDGRPDYVDLDSDGDGTPDSERVTGDDDGDGLVGDVEGLGDADGDGLPNTDDMDSDNDTLPDAVEAGADLAAPVDSDRDGVPDFLDLDSDNDGVPDLYEASAGEVDVAALDGDRDGRVDADVPGGVNGLADAVETGPDSGIPVFVIADTDGDGARDYVDLDSDGDGIGDVVESGGEDADANGLVDTLQDVDGDGVPDAIDVDLTGGSDADGDGIDDDFDTQSVEGASIESDDVDDDGIADIADVDVDGDGIVDGSTNALTETGALPDADGDGVPDLRDPATAGGGADADGGADGGADGADDGSADAGGTTAGDDTGGDAGDATAGEGPGGTGTGGADAGGTDTAGSGVDAGGSDTGGPGDGGEGPPADDPPSGSGRVETGLAGYGGCSVDGRGARDPLLPALAIAVALFGLRGRRRAR